VNGFKPPGRLRLLIDMAGDLLYGLLVTLGWQPKEQREDGEGGKPPAAT